MPVLGLGMIIGVRSTPFREDHMVRKAEMLAAKLGSVEGEGAPEREGLKLAEDVSFKEQVIFTGSTDWTPDQAEHYIDWRIQSVDTDIARLRQQLDDLIAQRKRCVPLTCTTAPRRRTVAGPFLEPRPGAARVACAARESEA